MFCSMKTMLVKSWCVSGMTRYDLPATDLRLTGAGLSLKIVDELRFIVLIFLFVEKYKLFR